MLMMQKIQATRASFMGVWLYSTSTPVSQVIESFTNNDGQQPANYQFTYNGTVVATMTYPTAPSTDSYGRYYTEVSGYRYTASKTPSISTLSNNIFKICRTGAGIEPIGETE